ACELRIDHEASFAPSFRRQNIDEPRPGFGPRRAWAPANTPTLGTCRRGHDGTGDVGVVRSDPRRSRAVRGGDAAMQSMRPTGTMEAGAVFPLWSGRTRSWSPRSWSRWPV